MKTLHRLFAALVANGALAAGPAWASCEGGAASIPGGPGADVSVPGEAGGVVEGQVAAVDHAGGRMILDTDRGLVHVVAQPDEIAGIQEGDVVEVAFVDEGESPE